MPSREGRHTARLSTWMMRYELVKTRNEALKLIQRKKILVKGVVGQTLVAYPRLEKKDIEIRADARVRLKGSDCKSDV